MKKIVTEFIATYILIFAGTGVVIADQSFGGAAGLQGIAAVWGFVIIALIYAFGDISGTHINPAVTVSFAADKRFEWRDVPGYLAAQFTGAIAASLTLHYLFPTHTTLAATSPAIDVTRAFILETMMMFILMMVILRVSVGAKEKGITAGIAIGGTVWLLVLFAGPITGTSLNPARSFAPALVSNNWTSIWIYLTAPFAGGLLAVITHRFIHNNEN